MRVDKGGGGDDEQDGGEAGLASLCVRDPKCPPDTPAAKCMRRFHPKLVLPWGATDDDVFDLFGVSVLEWLWEGFNAVVVGCGDAGSGKTSTLFGSGGGPLHEGAAAGSRSGGSRRGGQAAEAAVEPKILGQCGLLLAGLFHCIRRSRDPANYRVGLSCWEVGPDEVVDLLAAREADDPMAGATAAGSGATQAKSKNKKKKQGGGRAGGAGGAGGGPGGRSRQHGFRFVTASVPDLASALEVIQCSHARSSNWTQATELSGGGPGGGQQRAAPKAKPNQAHAFVRVVLHDVSQKSKLLE